MSNPYNLGVYVKAGIRLSLIIYLVIYLSWDCLFCIIGLAASYYFFLSPPDNDDSESSSCWNNNGLLVNPFKGKTGRGYLTTKEDQDIDHKVAQLVLYDAASTESINNFGVVQQNSDCSFAKRAKLWGSPLYNQVKSLEENTTRLIPTFYKFTLAFENLGLDAFLIELPGSMFCASLEDFGDAVRRVLRTLREADIERRRHDTKNDPNLDEKMKEKRLKYLVEVPEAWSLMSWVFEFNKVTFFVTTFAPFYPETNSRFSFGSDHGYILFQPEMSFAIHDLPPDSPTTNWVCPKNVRDKIRVAFRESGREYDPPLKLGEPMVHEIVKRLEPEDPVIQWWLPPEARKEKQSL